MKKFVKIEELKKTELAKVKGGFNPLLGVLVPIDPPPAPGIIVPIDPMSGLIVPA